MRLAGWAGLVLVWLVSCGAPPPPGPTVEVRFPGTSERLSEADPHLQEVLQRLAAAPGSYLVKSHDVGPPTDYDADYAWHLLAKERAAGWPYGKRLGLVCAQTHMGFTFAFAPDNEALRHDRPYETVLHTIDAAALRTDLGQGLSATVTFLPYDSATLFAAVSFSNAGHKSRDVEVVQDVFREIPPSQDPQTGRQQNPYRWPGTIKSFCATRQMVDTAMAQDGHGAGGVYEEWEEMFRDFADKPFGHLLAWVDSDRPPVEQRFIKPGDPVEKDELLQLGIADAGATLSLHQRRYRVRVPAGGTGSLATALAYRRYTQYGEGGGPPKLVRGVTPYARTDTKGAVATCRKSAGAALAEDWPGRLRDSLSAYQHYPLYDVPVPGWNEALLNALQLPRGNTTSPHKNLATPFYNFCRAFGNEWRLWWSYGMHAHEGLSISTTVATDPRLAMDHLRGHFALQEPDGFIPYGANPISEVGKRVFMVQAATPPFISWEAWLAYLWSGDRDFLAEAYACLVRYHDYWLTYRDRTGEGLCCWLDNGETVRDNGRVPTWHYEGAPVFFQEALDLNCYLARQERVLAGMAEELGREEDAARYRDAFARRARVINGYQWDEADRCYYGTCEAGDRIYSQPAQDPRMRPTLRLKSDYTPRALFVRVQDIGTLMPLWGGVAPVDRALRLVELLNDKAVFAAPWPIPVLAMNNPSFGEGGVAANWNSCTWLEMNLLIAVGLKDYRLYDDAARLALRSAEQGLGEVLRTGHFNEFYNPFEGQGLGLYEYIWACVTEAMVRDVLLGVRATRGGLQVLPALPKGWTGASLRGLHVREHVIDLTVERDAAATDTQATVAGSAWSPVLEQRGIEIGWDRLASYGPGPVRIHIVQPEQVSQALGPPVPLPEDLLAPLPARGYIVPTTEELAFNSTFAPYAAEAMLPPPVPWRARKPPSR